MENAATLIISIIILVILIIVIVIIICCGQKNNNNQNQDNFRGVTCGFLKYGDPQCCGQPNDNSCTQSQYPGYCKKAGCGTGNRYIDASSYCCNRLNGSSCITPNNNALLQKYDCDNFGIYCYSMPPTT